MLTDLVSNPSQASANIRSYQKALADHMHGPEMQRRMKYVHAWYAIRQDDRGWLFGPSKFIGYAESNADAYISKAWPIGPRDGRVTERALPDWFHEVEPGTRFHDELYDALCRFLQQFGHSGPRKDARISVLREVFDEISNTSEAAERIRVDPGICGGRPHVRGTRVRVSDILQLMAAGVEPTEILADYPYLEDADLRAALAWGAAASEHRIVHAA